MLPNGKTAGKTRELDQLRLDEIRKQVPVHVYYECQVDEWLKKDAIMKQKYANYMDEGLIKNKFKNKNVLLRTNRPTA